MFDRIVAGGLKIFQNKSKKMYIAVPATALLSCLLSANAQVINNRIDDPVQTSNVDNGNPSDIEITEDGSIEVEQSPGFVAVTVDSSNNLIHDGDIIIEDSDNTTGILITAGNTSTIDIEGDIELSEDYEREDDDNDDDLDGPFAIGTGRTGIVLEGGGTHTGDFIIDFTSSTIIEGNDSAGYDLNSAIDGSLSLGGSISVDGDRALGLSVAEDVSGDVRLSGSVVTRGEDAQAVELNGDIGGNLTIETSITSYGFESTSATNYVAPSDVDEDTDPIEERLDDEALLDNLGAVKITGSIDEGLLVNGIIDDFITEEEADDETKDTIEDFDENRATANITSLGTGEAMLITSEGRTSDLVIGTVTETVRDTLDDDDDDDETETLAVFTYDQGFINRGNISADGQNIGFDATGLRIEGASDGSTSTRIEGGIFSSGSITATAFEADALALSIGANTEIGTIDNEGAITSTTFTLVDNTAIAINIDAGADITRIDNDGSITATSVGQTGTAYGIRDQNGELVTINNTGTIAGALADDDRAIPISGEGIAIDVRANTTGVTLRQFLATPDDDVNDDGDVDNDDVGDPLIFGDVLFGSGDDVFTSVAGSMEGDTDFGTGDATFSFQFTDYEGDLRFASGTHTASISNAEFEGDIFFTDSVGTLTFGSGTDFTGNIVTSNSAVALTATDTDIVFTNDSVVELSEFNISGDSSITFQIDPALAADPIISVSGASNISGDLEIAAVLTSLPQGSFNKVLVTADTLTIDGDLTEAALVDLPFIYNTSLVETDQNSLELAFDLKTAEELGLDANQSAAYDSLIGVLSSDDTLGAAISALTTEQEFNQTYDLLLPQRTNASTRFLISQTNAALGALRDRLDVVSLGDPNKTGVWAQQTFTTLDEDATAESPGYNGDGFGISAGADRPMFGLDRVGFMISYNTGEFEEKTGGQNPVNSSMLSAGLYAQTDLGPFDVRTAAQVGSLDFISDRQVILGEETYLIEGDWGGFSQSAMFSIAAPIESRTYYAKPEVIFDWFSATQDAYTETGGGGLIDAEIGEVDTDQSSVTGRLSLGRKFQFQNDVIRAEISGGYKSVLSSTPYSATVRYLGSDESFVLTAADEPEDSVIAGISFVSEGEILSTRFTYDFETSDGGVIHYFGASLRWTF